jgi:hypothetical protein
MQSNVIQKVVNGLVQTQRVLPLNSYHQFCESRTHALHSMGNKYLTDSSSANIAESILKETTK